MSAVEVSKLSKSEIAELACTYASLILFDDGQDITGEKIATLIKTAGVNVEAYWPKLFAKAIEGKDIREFFHFGGAAAAEQTVSPVAAGNVAKSDPKADKKKQQKNPEPPKEEEDDGADMGGLFD